VKYILLMLVLLPIKVAALPAGDTGQPDAPRQAQLRQILQQNCPVCHGRALKGDLGPALTAKALAAKDERLLVATILEGRDGTAMPAWGAMIKESEARWMLQLLRSGKN
jgi:cytochrome c55X